MEQYIIVLEEKRARDSAYSACAGERMENGTDRANRFLRFYVTRIFHPGRYVNSRRVTLLSRVDGRRVHFLVGFPYFSSLWLLFSFHLAEPEPLMYQATRIDGGTKPNSAVNTASAASFHENHRCFLPL